MTTAFITLLTNESYLPGVLTLGKVLKDHHQTNQKLAILLDSSSLSDSSIELITSIYDDVIDIKDQLIYSSVEDVKKLLGRPELAVTYTKILLWNLTQYSKLIYLDADTLPVQELDHLFDVSIDDHEVAASPDAGWPDIFNSGVLVLKPSVKTFSDLVTASTSTASDGPGASFDGADQGLLNEHFNIKSGGKHWKKLPFIYNVTPNASYQYTPAYDRFEKDIKLIHFIGSIKPWNSENFFFQGKSDDIHKLWWSHFKKYFPGELGASILKLRGEAAALDFSKISNQWDEDGPGVSEVSATTDEAPPTYAPSLPPVFPWERRESREPTRVFSPHGTHEEEEHTTDTITSQIKKSIETLSHLAVSKPSGSSLKGKYNIDDSESNAWDPTASLDEIAKLPSKLINKKREEESKK